MKLICFSLVNYCDYKRIRKKKKVELQEGSASASMVEQMVGNVVSGLHGRSRANGVLCHHLVIEKLKPPLTIHRLIPHLTNVMQNTARAYHHRQILKLHLSPLLQTPPPRFQLRKGLFGSALNLLNLLIKRVLRPRQIRVRVRH